MIPSQNRTNCTDGSSHSNATHENAEYLGCVQVLALGGAAEGAVAEPAQPSSRKLLPSPREQPRLLFELSSKSPTTAAEFTLAPTTFEE
eukprot:5256359-Pyramimonas_sp.AAC.1